MTNNNIWDCADMRPMISAKWSIDDGSVFYIFFFLYFWYVHYRTKVKQLQKRKGKNSIFYI
jgi:hypothetical protein